MGTFPIPIPTATGGLQQHNSSQSRVQYISTILVFLCDWRYAQHCTLVVVGNYYFFMNIVRRLAECFYFRQVKPLYTFHFFYLGNLVILCVKKRIKKVAKSVIEIYHSVWATYWPLSHDFRTGLFMLMLCIN